MPTSHELIVAIDQTEIADRLHRYARDAQGAMSPNTVRAIRSDTSLFTTWCAEHGHQPLPANPETIAAFIDAMAADRKPATVRRYVASIAHLHRAADFPTPTASPKVKLAVKRMNRQRGVRQDQAAALNRPVVNAMIAKAGDRLIDLRNVALLSVAYDTMCRRSELVDLNVEDMQIAPDGTGSILVRRSKTDQGGEGMVRFLASDTVHYLQRWRQQAEIESGLLFRSVSKGGEVRGGLDAGDVSRIFRRMTKSAGTDIPMVSGHSTRIGACQDMVAAGLEIGEVMQAGGWRSPTMVARYSERQNVRRGAAFKLAVIQDRA